MSLRRIRFGGELDRSQWIPDLVREAARNLAPGRLALGLQELRYLVEHEHEALRAGIARKRRAGADELAPAGLGPKRHLLAPFGLARLDVALQHLVQLGEERLAGRDLRERAASRTPQDRRRGWCPPPGSQRAREGPARAKSRRS
jgi:hypothetical protein